MIVYAWTDLTFQNQLTTGTAAARVTHAQAALTARGIYLQYPMVITEAEYEGAFSCQKHRRGIPDLGRPLPLDLPHWQAGRRQSETAT
jgi:hypothetical protein